MNSEAPTARVNGGVADLAAAPVTIIRPPKGWAGLDLAELWRYRELFGFLVWRDIKVRYKQTLLGFAWAILVPVSYTVVFTVFFGNMAKLPTDNLQKSVFYMAGLVIFKYFTTALSNCSNSLVGNQALLTKIYLPRLIIPGSTVIAGLVELAVAMAFLFVLMLYYHIIPALTSLLLPLLIAVAMGTALGVGLVFAALNVKYRDVRELVPFLTQLWMYCTVIVPFSRIPERLGAWRYLYGLNPMAGVVEGFRWCLAHHAMSATAEPPWRLLCVGTPVMAIVLFMGLYYFKRVERQFADII